MANVDSANLINISAGNIAFNDNVPLTGDINWTTTGTTGNVTFGQNLDGAFNVTLNAPTTTFGANVGLTTALQSLTTDANGTTRFTSSGNAPITVRATELNFNDNVTTAGNITFVGTNATFGKTFNPTASNVQGVTLNISNNLTLSAGCGKYHGLPCDRFRCQR